MKDYIDRQDILKIADQLTQVDIPTAFRLINSLPIYTEEEIKMKWSEFKISKGAASAPIQNYEETEIECPICGRHIHRRTDIVFTTYPPKHQYECLQCGWTDYA